MIAPRQTISARIAEESQVGGARRLARRLALELGLTEVLAERAAIVATEAARNVVQHGRGGELLFRPLAGPALEVLALDRGPGVQDVARAMEDGYSTAGTAGQGLGAISRIASEFDMYSVAGRGTALVARIGDAGADRHVGAVCLPVASEERCGDAWVVERTPGHALILVADGLGHGAHAADAAEAAVRAGQRHAGLAPAAALELVHAALRPTRGAAVAIARSSAHGGLQYAAIGNVAGALVGQEGTRKMVSLPGTAGHQARRIQEFEYPWPDGALLFMHTDGLAGHWDLAAYPGLVLRHPALVAGVLYRDFVRGRDDVTVLVMRKVAA